MYRREFLSTFGTGVAVAAALAYTPKARAATRPNIVLIVADDLGYGELSIQGAKDILTPNIDSIARNGVRFTQGYVTCPVCGPTRAGLLTGRYQQRFGFEFNSGPPGTESPQFGIPPAETILPERLKSLGYATGMFGKWHVGMQNGRTPTDRGFDEFFGFLGGSHSYTDAMSDSPNPILKGKERVPSISYATEDFAREACAFIERHAQKPFFLYMPFNAVHSPMDVLPKHVEPFAGITDEKRRKFAGMLSALDLAVGKIISTLRAVEAYDNTLIIFLSDNGGPTQQITSSNGPLRGFKGQLLEGGIRVPFLMQWPGKISPDGTYTNPVSALDLLPTILTAAAGETSPIPTLDGVNLLPYLSGKQAGRPHETLFWRYGNDWAVRSGDYKLVTTPENAVALYDLAKDVHEDNDLSASSPDKVKEMRAAYETWNAKNIAPLWNRPERPTRRAAGNP